MARLKEHVRNWEKLRKKKARFHSILEKVAKKENWRNFRLSIHLFTFIRVIIWFYHPYYHLIVSSIICIICLVKILFKMLAFHSSASVRFNIDQLWLQLDIVLTMIDTKLRFDLSVDWRQINLLNKRENELSWNELFSFFLNEFL